MKNATRTKRNDLTINDILKRDALRKFKASLNLTGKFRQAMSMFFIYALVVVPLLTTDIAVRQAHAQSQPTGTTGTVVVTGSTTISGDLIILGNLNFPPEPPPEEPPR